MRNHGTDPTCRFGLMRERIDAMKAIWTEDEAEYHGNHVDFDPIWAWPKPVQTPHPPILVGGNGKGVLDRVLAYGDEWLPNRLGDEEKLIARIDKLQRRAAEEGRGRIGVTLYGAPRDPAALARYQEAGATRAVFWLPPAARDVVEPKLDRYAGIAAQLA